jgi:DNA-binding transcriptional MerR regulator
MQYFSIRDIENLSGIKAHTLRIWEQRYQLIMPARRESRHRLYNNEDLRRILRISYLYHRGYKISKIAGMPAEEIDRLSLEYHGEVHFELFINQFVEAALDLDQERFDQLFRGLFQHLGFEKAMIHVVYPYLEKIGRLWMTGNLLPAQEHFSSQLIRKHILLDTESIRTPTVPGSLPLVMFTPPGEFHEIPLLLIANLLRKNGFRVVYFGTNADINTLADYLNAQGACILFFHLLTNFTDLSPGEYVTKLRSRFPGTPIIASGPIATKIDQSIDGVRTMHSIHEIRMLKPVPV